MTGSTTTEAELKAENARLADRLALLSDVSRQVSSSLELETVLQNIVDAACKLASARFGALAVFDDERRPMMVINYNTDLGDAWEWADQPCYPNEFSGMAYRMGINFIVYSMTH